MKPTPGLPTNRLLWLGASARVLSLRGSGCRNLALRALMDKPRPLPIDLSPIRSSTSRPNLAHRSRFRANFGRKTGSTREPIFLYLGVTRSPLSAKRGVVMENQSAIRNVFGVAGLLAAGFASSGCVVAVHETSKRPTVGMELMDLQKAKKSGAITGAEYEMQRAAILKRDSGS
jgi:hypothetical protein